MNVLMPEPATDDCREIASIIARAGGKWSVLVVVLLSRGPKRFNEIKRGVGGISQRMLTFTLRGLERDGLLARAARPTSPPHVDYELTPLGATLWGAIAPLADWAKKNRDDIILARSDFDDRDGLD